MPSIKVFVAKSLEISALCTLLYAERSFLCLLKKKKKTYTHTNIHWQTEIIPKWIGDWAVTWNRVTVKDQLD